MTDQPTDLQASIVICTYNRPLLLEAAVRSCLADATRQQAKFEIVIADNSPSGHAASLVAELVAQGHPVRSVPASPPNISIARNAGLRAAQAPLVAFLDDDLQVEPGWLDHFLVTMATSGADAAIGPVRPTFEQGQPPAWDPQGERFTRVLDMPSGFILRDDEANRTGFTVSTASSIWRADRCFADAEPFDPAFGASGGEDLDLILRLQKRGRHFVWCAEAALSDSQIWSRSSQDWSVRSARSVWSVHI